MAPRTGSRGRTPACRLNLNHQSPRSGTGGTRSVSRVRCFGEARQFYWSNARRSIGDGITGAAWLRLESSVNNLSTLIPPPPAVCARAWERAFVLTEEHAARLLDDRGGSDASNVLHSGPYCLTWDQIGSVCRLFGRLIEVRI